MPEQGRVRQRYSEAETRWKAQRNCRLRVRSRGSAKGLYAAALSGVRQSVRQRDAQIQRVEGASMKLVEVYVK